VILSEPVDMEEVDVLFHNGIEHDEAVQMPSARKRSMSGQPDAGSASKKPRLSEDDAEIVEL